MRIDNDLISSPYTLAIFSVLLTALLTLIVEKYVSWAENKKNRQAQLRILKSYFIVERGALVDIQDMDNDQIHPYVNSSVALTLLRGEYLSPQKDEELIISLNKYVEITEQINRVFKRIDLGSSGFANNQKNGADETMRNLKNAVPAFLTLVDSCVNEVEIKLQE